MEGCNKVGLEKARDMVGESKGRPSARADYVGPPLHRYRHLPKSSAPPLLWTLPSLPPTLLGSLPTPLNSISMLLLSDCSFCTRRHSCLLRAHKSISYLPHY